MPAPGALHSAPPLAAATPSLLVSLVVGVVLFVVVIAVIVVVMAILQAVLPGTDTEAEAVHERELEEDRLAHAGVHDPGGDPGDPGDPGGGLGG